MLLFCEQLPTPSNTWTFNDSSGWTGSAPIGYNSGTLVTGGIPHSEAVILGRPA